jgi:hypothetical protein
MPYDVDSAKIGDYEANVTFAKRLFMTFKQKNKDEGINGAQALWLHHRIRAWNVSFMGVLYTVDIVNMAASGDIETACLSLLYGQPDDMSMPFHWFTQDRINFLTAEMKIYLGWP